MSAFKRTRKTPDGSTTESATYYIRFTHKNRNITRKTPFTNKEDAERHETKLRAQLHKDGWAILDQLRLRQPPAELTIAQLTHAYTRLAPAAGGLTNPKTITHNIHALRNILARAQALDPAALTDPQLAALDALNISHLNAKLITDYKNSVLTRAQDLDPEDAQSLYRSANSYLRAARSILNKTMLAAYKDAGHKLPDATANTGLKEFLTRPAFKGADKHTAAYKPAPDALLAKTFHALPDLERADPNAYIAICLSYGFGMRKSEISQAAHHWFIEIDGRPTVRLKMKTKNGAIDVDIHCQLDAWPRLQPHVTAAAGRPHLLHGTATERTEDVFRRISQWMRHLGWETQKTIHEFRAYVGCKIAEHPQLGLLAARDFLRHAQYATTEKNYGRYIRQKITPVPLQIPIISEPTIVQQQAQA